MSSRYKGRADGRTDVWGVRAARLTAVVLPTSVAMARMDAMPMFWACTLCALSGPPVIGSEAEYRKAVVVAAPWASGIAF